MKLSVASACLLPILTMAAPALAAPKSGDGKQSIIFSVAEDYAADTLRSGPLFDRATSALLTAYERTPADFFGQLVQDPELSLFAGAGKSVPLSIAAIKAIFESCAGPFPHDEGADWAEFSMICRTDNAAPIASFVSFSESAEVNFSVWFKKDKIAKILATETIREAHGFGKDAIDPTWTRK